MKNKMFTFLLAVMASASMLFAQSGTCGNNLTWNLTNGVLVISGTGEMTDFSSSSVPWYSYRSSVQFVVIGNGVTSISSLAFYQCSALTSVTIPNSVTRIGNQAFSYCSSLVSVTIPNSVTSIKYYAFTNCSSLSYISIPSSVTSIGDSPFRNCTSLTSINVENGNPNYISQDGALFNKSKTTLIQYPAGKTASSYVIPNSVTSIGIAAFEGCSALTYVTIPNSVTRIGSSAFRNCTGLTSVTIPNSVTSIVNYAFEGCSALTYVTIPNSVTSIGGSAFYYCTGLTSLTIPNSVTSIGEYAFYQCTGLTSVTIPNSVTSIGRSAFSGCKGLTSPVYNAHVFAFMPTSYSGAYTIPDGIESIAGGAFEICRGLTSVTIPNSVTSIGGSAFSGCTGLTSVTIGNSVTSIGTYAFYGCGSLTSIEIPNSVTSIGEDAFRNCTGLTSVTNYATTPQTITTNVFDNVNISACTLYVPAESLAAYRTADVWKDFGTIQAISGDTPCLIASGTCGENLTWELSCDSILTISGQGAMADYKYGNPAPWSSIKSSIKSVVISNGITSIGNRAFPGCYYLTVVTIPNSITNIGNEAFFDCDGLTTIEIPNSVTSIGNDPFASCDRLTSINVANANATYCSKDGVLFNKAASTLILYPGGKQGEYSIPNSVTSIVQNAFHYCRSLTSIEIPNSVTSIDNHAFIVCDRLTSINVANANATYCSKEGVLFNKAASILIRYPEGKQGEYSIPNSVISIGNYAFCYSKGLASMIIPNSVTSIGSSAFYGSSSLTSVTIPNSVTSIGSSAFYSCSALTSVTNYATTPQTINANVFGSVNISACTLNVPTQSVNAYKNATVWKNFGTIQAIGGNTPCTPISGTCGANLTWTLSCDSVLSISGTGTMPDFNSSSDNPWYAHRNAIKSVIIGNGITSIGKAAFYECSSLTSIEFPNSVTNIGAWAFESCAALVSVTIPNSVTSIEDYAFENCCGLTSATIGNKVTSIGYGAFGNCSGLTSITLGEKLASIGNFAFYNCTALASVTNYATTPQTISSNVFGSVNISSCTLHVPAESLTAYKTASIWKDFGTIQAIGGETPCTPISGTCGGNLTWKLSCDGVLTISGTGAMANFNSASDIPWYEYRDAIKSIVINKGVTSIASNAFQKCTNLTSVTIPTSVTSIGQVAFYECTALTTVKIPSSVTIIGMGAFTYCSSLTSVTIPNSVRNIGQAAFGYCTGLKSVTIGSGITSIEYGLFGNCTSLTSVTIPNNVTSIGQVAFIGCTSLTSVTIPNSVTSIGMGAFSNCSTLTSVTIPNGITSIEQETFGNCSSLTSIVIPNGVTSIGDWAFENCTALTSVTIPSSVTSISDEVFSGCTALRSVTNYATTPQAIDAYVFDGVNISSCTLHVPAESLAAYRAAIVWKDFGTIQAIGGNTPCLIASGTCGDNLTWKLSCDSVLTISGTGAMTDYSNSTQTPWAGTISLISRVVIDDGVNSIGDFSFAFCGNLKSVYIGKNVKSIGGHAFYSCYSLPKVSIPNSVMSIGLNSFASCDKLASVTIGDNLARIGNGAFSRCVKLANINIPNSVTEIAVSAFAGCESLPVVNSIRYADTYLVEAVDKTLTSYSIRSGARWIGDNAFLNCTNLNAMDIPIGVISIGTSAFSNCTGLTTVTIPNTVSSIGTFAFQACYGLKSITNHATKPQQLDVYVFSNANLSACTLYVPAESLSAYRTADVWKDFGQILPINAEDVDVTETTVTASATTADIVWPKVTGAATYTLEIKKNGELICTLTFDEEGHMISMSFAAPSRDNTSQQTQAASFSFTITGLESGTTYNYTMTVKDNNGNVLKTESGTFTTIGAEGIEDAQSDQVQSTKILRNGQIFIQRGEKIYTITGQKIQSY